MRRRIWRLSYMARIRPQSPEEATPEAQAMFEKFKAERGNIPNMFRTMALRPEIALTAAAHMNAVFTTGTVETKLKEMLAVRVSQINDCYYCKSSHTALAKQLGASEALLDAMYHIDRHRDLFTPAEHAALAFAERMTTDAHGVSEDIWIDLSEYFDDGQIIEIAAVIGLFNYFNRFNDALNVDVTRPPDSAPGAGELESN
jgi:uncharacterized peroxidase-related enzyme